MTMFSLFLSRKKTKKKGNENYDYDGINRTSSDKIIFNFTWRQFKSQTMADLSAGDWGEVLVVIDHQSYLQIVACLHWWNKDDSHDRRWNVWFTVGKSLVFHNNDQNSMIKLCTLRNHLAWWDLWVQLLVFVKFVTNYCYSWKSGLWAPDIGAA